MCDDLVAICEQVNSCRFAEGRIPGALCFAQSDLALRLEEAPKHRDLLVVRAAGNRSMRPDGFVKTLGYTRVTDLDGGASGWIEAGNPVEKDG